MRVATEIPATPWDALGDRIPSRGNRLTRVLARAVLRAIGWTPVGVLPNLPKFVIIAAPHTSNWDFPLAVVFLYACGFRVSFFAKDTLFRPPLGWVMRFLGGRPVDRSATHGVVEQTVRAIGKADRLVLALAPEGTRKRAERWRTGFYRVAVGAKLPIVLGFFDYGRKEVGLGPTIWPTGDLEADLADIQAFYRTKTGKRPERFATAPARGGPLPKT